MSEKVHLQSNLATYTATTKETRKKRKSESIERKDKRYAKGLKSGRGEKSTNLGYRITFRASKGENATVQKSTTKRDSSVK